MTLTRGMTLCRACGSQDARYAAMNCIRREEEGDVVVDGKKRQGLLSVDKGVWEVSWHCGHCNTHWSVHVTGWQNARLCRPVDAEEEEQWKAVVKRLGLGAQS